MIRRGAVLGLASTFVVSWGMSPSAQLHAPKQTEPPGPAEKYTTQSVQAEVAGDHAKALSFADEAVKADPKEPWAYYDRGDALTYLHRTDEAVAAFREAERRFPGTDTWGKSVAIWGQANAFSQEGRCQDAAPFYERYAAFVDKIDQEAAALARQYGKHCTPRPAVK